MAKPGVTTIEIDQAVEALYAKHGAMPLFKGYPGPKVPVPGRRPASRSTSRSSTASPASA